MAARAADLASSIRVVANRTGIGPHTLRVWERRYGFPRPRRADGVRAYSEEDIAKLKLVARALEAGFRAGEVVPLPVADLERLLDAARLDIDERQRESAPDVREATRSSPAPDVDEVRRARPDDRVSQVIAELARDDVEALQATLRGAARALGAKRFVTELADPLAVRVGELWESGRLEVRHEHVLSACLTRRLHALLGDDARRDRAAGPAPAVVLGTLPGEHHVLPLDMIAVYLSAAGASPRMLGADTPPREIAATARAMKADVVGISISAAADPSRARRAVRELLDELPRRVKLWLGGAGSAAVLRGMDVPGVQHVDGWQALDAALEDVRAGA